MAFRALLISKSPETDTAMTVACQSAEIQVDAFSDIFSAIETVKKRTFSCVIVDWAFQPEASFLLKRARESEPNKNTVAIAVVDHEPTSAEMRDSRIDFLIYRPISATEAGEVLAKAGEKMQPLSAEEAAEAARQNVFHRETHPAVADDPQNQSQPYQPTTSNHDNSGEFTEDSETESAAQEREARPDGRVPAFGLLQICAAALVLAAAFCLWRSRDVIRYLAHTPEGRVRVLKESVEALFNLNQTGALPVSSAISDAQQDAYFSRTAARSTPSASAPPLEVVATESNLPDTRVRLQKPSDLPLPTPVYVHQEAPPVHVERTAIPQSMRDSAPIEQPIVVTVNPAQMMPVSTPQSQPIIQQSGEPVALTEEAARALLVQKVDPVYPPEAAAQKLHGAVVLQTLIGRDGAVEDVKFVRGYFVLGRAAIAAVKQWRFQPYSVDGHPASAQTVITINFTYPPS